MRKRRTNEEDIPPWLAQMRAITGTKEVSGSGNNPAIMAMADEIARVWSDVAGMEAYCDQYTGDDIAWCGLAAGFCLSESDIMPPFGKTDTNRFLWADSFRTDPRFVNLGSFVKGCIIVMTRSGGNHVTFAEEDLGSSIRCRGGNQSDMVNESDYSKSNITGYMWPSDYPLPLVPPAERPLVKKGSKGSYVVSVQSSLGVYPADGDFGSITDGAVRGFQAAAGLTADGQVGNQTWAALDSLDARKAEGDSGLDSDMIADITQLAETSAIAGYNWRDRGRAPYGYTAGIACCYGLMVKLLGEGDDTAAALAQKDRNNDTDALTYYKKQFKDAGMDNSQDSINTMRHLFVMLMGLGMRESSGRYSEGRDMSATNVEADTAEAAFAQTSWDIRGASSLIPPLLPTYWDSPVGFLETFQKGVTLKSSELGGYGSGDGARYQFLAKFAPAFHAQVTALGMRYRRSHWGPINRSEVEIRRDADNLLKEVEVIIEGGKPEPGPEPEPPDVAVANMSIDPSGGAKVVVTGGAPPHAQVDLPEGVVPTITITVDPPESVIINVTGGAGEA